MRHFLTLIIIAFSFSLAACAPDLSSSTYSGGQVGVANQTTTGTIVGKRLVTINASREGINTGTAVGAVGGAVAGSFIGGGTRENILGGLGGAVVGGVLGNAIDKKVNTKQGFEYMIRINKGHTIAVTQTADNNLAIGTPVMVVYGNPVRVVPTNN
jgi:outer membrane lipoprotein SlyB